MFYETVVFYNPHYWEKVWQTQVCDFSTIRYFCSFLSATFLLYRKNLFLTGINHFSKLKCYCLSQYFYFRLNIKISLLPSIIFLFRSSFCWSRCFITKKSFNSLLEITTSVPFNWFALQLIVCFYFFYKNSSLRGWFSYWTNQCQFDVCTAQLAHSTIFDILEAFNSHNLLSTFWSSNNMMLFCSHWSFKYSCSFHKWELFPSICTVLEVSCPIFNYERVSHAVIIVVHSPLIFWITARSL